MAFMAISALFSCDDMLEWTPETELASSSFWKSANDCKLYTNSYYNLFLPNYRKSTAITLGMFTSDFTSDNAVKGSYDATLNGETNAPTSGGGANGFQFEQIAKLNYFLENYTRFDGNFDGIKQYLGETYFFHSLLYFERVQKFGDFQYTKKVLDIDSPELYMPRLPRNQVIDSILATLDLAIEYLPKKADLNERRISKEVALLIKSRVALYEGTWEKYHANDDFKAKEANPQKYFGMAANAVDSLMEIGSCGLDNVGEPMAYNRVFNRIDYTNSKEIMLWRPYERGYGHSITYTSTGGNNGGATRDLVEAYLRTDGQPIDLATYKDDQYGDIAKDRDPRLFQSILFPMHLTFVLPDLIMYLLPAVNHKQNNWQNVTGYQIYKGHDWADSQRSDGGENYGGVVATIYYRYAEALLNYAEAKAELGEATQEVIDLTVNALRTRAGMPEEALLQIGNVPNDLRNDWGIPALLYEIRRERRVELAFEGFRLNDLKRWAVLTKVMNNWKPYGVREDIYKEGSLLTTLQKDKFGDPIVVDGHNVIMNIPDLENPTKPYVMSKGWLPNDDDDGSIVRKFVADEKRNNKKYMDPYTGNTATEIVLRAGYSLLEKVYLSPIPKVEISLNNQIVQNPGW